jgi:hypothetical protein
VRSNLCLFRGLYRDGVAAYALQEFWFNRALASAGIDRSCWLPGLGIEDNERTAQAVYAYYGRLFIEHPYLQWAGFAGLIGPAFYAGFEDLGLFPDPVRAAVIAVLGRASRRLARDAAGDLGFYETTFLVMQKKIFEDQAPMHEAYLAGGVAQIEEFYRARIIDAATLEAWRQIDAGRRDPAAAAGLAAGNRTLLFREQYDIIDRFYARMFGYQWPLGTVFTYLITLLGAPSVPGAHSFPERYPLIVDTRLPRMVIDVRTPLAAGNIAIFADRWKLIDADTLPAFLAFIGGHFAQACALLATPVSQRATRYRLLARTGQLAVAAVTDWGVALRAAPPWPGAPSARPAKPLRVTAASVDLTSPPTRESAGFAPDAGTRVWMDARRAPFAITVTLPGGRAYRARAQLAVLLSTAPAGDPNRLTVQLPAADLDAAARLIGEYAAEWGFPADAVDAWRVAASSYAATDRRYSTHVFTAADLGFVRLEFQVSQHVREGAFVIAALFSWPEAH